MLIPYRYKRLSSEQKVNIITDYLSNIPYKDIAVRNKTTIPTAKRIVSLARKGGSHGI